MGPTTSSAVPANLVKYPANSSRANRLTFGRGGAKVMGMVKEYDLLNRLKSTATSNKGGFPHGPSGRGISVAMLHQINNPSPVRAVSTWSQTCRSSGASRIRSPNVSVTVNLNRAERQGEYFHAAAILGNSTAAVYQIVTNMAVLNNGTNTDIIASNFTGICLPPQTETFSYDDIGSLLADGRRLDSWDAENRLIKMENLTHHRF